MIVRIWHGRTRLSDADAYESFMKNRAAPDYASVDRLRQIFFTRRDDGDISHFLLDTLWDSIEAVKKFAGDDLGVTKCYPEDDEFLLEKEAHSLNHQVFFSQPEG
jgi:hypothetical protein